MNFRDKKRRDSQTPDLFQEPLFSIRDNSSEFAREWNSKLWLPKLILTDRQCTVMKNAMERPFFREHWKLAINLLPKCPFLLFKKKPRMDLDWFCNGDNFDKIIEGKYLDEKYQPKPDQIENETKAKRVGNDEEIT